MSKPFSALAAAAKRIKAWMKRLGRRRALMLTLALLTIGQPIVLSRSIDRYEKQDTADAAQPNNRQEQISISQFVSDARKGEVTKAAFAGRGIHATYKDGHGADFIGAIPDQIYVELIDKGVDFSVDDSFSAGQAAQIFWNILFMVPGIIICFSILGGNRFIRTGRRARLIQAGDVKTTLADVAGQEIAIEEIKEVIAFIKDPERFRKLGARLPKGMLLMGPPGTGKTLLARAVAGESAASFIASSGANFRETFVGQAPRAIRDLFALARKNAPCIIFIDEIETLARRRGGKLGSNEEDATLNTLLVEMDGFDPMQGVFLIAATNRPEIIDEALLRPGRFDRQVVLDAPDVRGRRDILGIHAKGRKIGQDVDLGDVAAKTTGLTGADLENLLNEAAIAAAKAGSKAIAREHIDAAYLNGILGRKKTASAISERDKKAIAYHEAGHAIVSSVIDGAKRPTQATIVPRGKSLGSVLSRPEEDAVIVRREALMADLAVLLAGRAAEIQAFGEAGSSTGASEDFRQAARIAKRMATTWLMGEKSPFGLAVDEESSEAAKSEAEEKAEELIAIAWKTATSTIAERKSGFEAIAEALLARETLSGAEIMELAKA